MKKRGMILIAGAASLWLAGAVNSSAAVPDDAVSQAYNTAVQIQDNLDGFDVTVKGTTSVAGGAASAQKTIRIQAGGIQGAGNLQVAIDIQTTDGEKQQYYTDGYFYSNQSGSNLKYAMDEETMLELLNYYVYLDFDSEYLSMLQEQAGDDGTVVYSFAASQESVGDYADKLLEGAQEEHQIEIVSLQGTVKADSAGVITERSIEMIYNVKGGDSSGVCVLDSDAVFNRTADVAVSLPDLSSYSEKQEGEPAVKITECIQTLYATNDVNVRAQNNVTAAVLGGIAAGSAMQELGYTDNGWVQIDYNGTTAYVCDSYVSETKPVIVTAMGGTMYAVRPVNVRDTYSTDGSVLGTLSTDEAVTVTGYADNGWIQVSYLGWSAYVYGSYLTWDVPASYYGDNTAGHNVMNDNNYYGDDTAGHNVMNDNNDEDDSYPIKRSYGTVIAYGMSAITVALDDGVTLSADKDNVFIEEGMYEGAYVAADYTGDTLYQVTFA